MLGRGRLWIPGRRGVAFDERDLALRRLNGVLGRLQSGKQFAVEVSPHAPGEGRAQLRAQQDKGPHWSWAGKWENCAG